MSTPMYAVRLKSIKRFHYRGILYRRFDPVNRHPDGRLVVLEHVVNRELRDHFVGTGYFEDVRPEAPIPVAPVAVPEPVAVAAEVATAAVAAADADTSPVVPEPPAPVNPNDMSNASINGPRSYGQPGKGDTQTEV